MFRKFAPAAALAAVLMATPALASDDGRPDEATADRIRTTLEAQGYEVGKIKLDDGLYEAYARKDRQRFEIFLDENMNIVRTEADD